MHDRFTYEQPQVQVHLPDDEQMVWSDFSTE